MRLLPLVIGVALFALRKKAAANPIDAIEAERAKDAAEKAAADAAATKGKQDQEAKRKKEIAAAAAQADNAFGLAMAGAGATAATASIASVGPSGIPYLAIAMASVTGAWKALTPEDKADIWAGRNPGTTAASRAVGGHAAGAGNEFVNQYTLQNKGR